VNAHSRVRASSPARARGWFRQALVFAWSAEPRTRISGRAVRADICLAAAATVAALATVKFGSSASSEAHRLVFPAGDGTYIPKPALPGSPPPVPWTAFTAAVVTTAPLAARRLAPLATFWAILAATVATSRYGTAVTFAAAVLAAYSAVVYSRSRGLALLSLPVAGVIVSAAFQDTTPPLPGRATALVVLVAIMIVGNAARVWKQRARDSQARIGHLQAEHEAQTLHAVELERARIASELHDVVTHNVSVMVVQAGAARQVLVGSPDEARAALLAVEASGRTAMTELRHLLGLLAPSGGPQAVTAAGETDTGALRPQPGLDRLRPLIGRVAAAGLPVQLRVSGSPRTLPPGLDLAAYRVIQEALTNVMKHAALARTTVRLDYRPGELVIEVADDGPPVPAAAAANRGGAPADPDAAPANASAGPGGGRGLLGLRERVALYGGEFDAGRRPGGGWLVRARLCDNPLPAEAVGPRPADPARPAPLAAPRR
jgi:signal transduction histidine kinase